MPANYYPRIPLATDCESPCRYRKSLIIVHLMLSRHTTTHLGICLAVIVPRCSGCGQLHFTFRLTPGGIEYQSPSQDYSHQLLVNLFLSLRTVQKTRMPTWSKPCWHVLIALQCYGDIPLPHHHGRCPSHSSCQRSNRS